VAQGQGKSSAGVAWKGGWRRLEPMLEDAQEWIAPWPLPCCGAPWGRGTGIKKVGSQEIPGVTGKYGLGVHNEAGQRLIEFCQENAIVIANISQQPKRRLYM